MIETNAISTRNKAMNLMSSFAPFSFAFALCLKMLGSSLNSACVFGYLVLTVKCTIAMNAIIANRKTYNAGSSCNAMLNAPAPTFSAKIL